MIVREGYRDKWERKREKRELEKETYDFEGSYKFKEIQETCQPTAVMYLVLILIQHSTNYEILGEYEHWPNIWLY